jgi:ribosomal protein S18 acetylase RimI-like enzyme
MKIDPMTTDDVPIIEQLAYEYNCELDPQQTRQAAVNRWIASVAQATTEGRHFFWLARVEEQITGFVSFRLSTNPFTQQTYGFIEDLYIAPPFRRRGYAEELARAAFAEISRQGASKIQLDVLVHNEQGLAFWSKLGLTLHHYVLEIPAS